MSAKKGEIACFVKVPARQLQDHPRCVFLAGVEAITVEFEKQDSHHKSCALVAVYDSRSEFGRGTTRKSFGAWFYLFGVTRPAPSAYNSIVVG